MLGIQTVVDAEDLGKVVIVGRDSFWLVFRRLSNVKSIPCKSGIE